LELKSLFFSARAIFSDPLLAEMVRMRMTELPALTVFAGILTCIDLSTSVRSGEVNARQDTSELAMALSKHILL